MRPILIFFRGQISLEVAFSGFCIRKTVDYLPFLLDDINHEFFFLFLSVKDVQELTEHFLA